MWNTLGTNNWKFLRLGVQMVLPSTVIWWDHITTCDVRCFPFDKKIPEWDCRDLELNLGFLAAMQATKLVSYMYVTIILKLQNETHGV